MITHATLWTNWSRASHPRTVTKKLIGGHQLATKSGDYCPDAGDLIWIDLSPTVGHEQSGRRPALVLTSSKYNAASGLCVACPITSRVRGYPFEVACQMALPFAV